MGAQGKSRWEQLYESYADHVLAYAARRVGLEEGTDVAADTFLTAWRRIDDIPSDALPWLYAVARNVIGNTRRAEHRRKALHVRLAASDRSDPADDPSLEVDARTDIVAAMHLLPEAEREALTLIAWEDLDIRCAAAVVGCSPSTFNVRVHRARRDLRRLLASTAIPDTRAG